MFFLFVCWRLMIVELELMWKEVAVTCFEVFFIICLVGISKSVRDIRIVWTMVRIWNRYLQIQVKSVTARSTLLSRLILEAVFMLQPLCVCVCVLCSYSVVESYSQQVCRDVMRHETCHIKDTKDKRVFQGWAFRQVPVSSFFLFKV